jgi:hypothetical protein
VVDLAVQENGQAFERLARRAPKLIPSMAPYRPDERAMRASGSAA